MPMRHAKSFLPFAMRFLTPETCLPAVAWRAKEGHQKPFSFGNPKSKGRLLRFIQMIILFSERNVHHNK
jgi:hypothetical protein